MTAEHVPVFIQSLVPIVNQYGYLAVGGLLFLEDFGLPVPGETVLITAAFYAGLGHLNIFLVFVIGAIAAIAGDNVGFAIGNYGGHTLVECYGKYVFLTPKRFAKAEAFFKQRGAAIVLVARFIDGLRQANGIIAGTSGMKWLKFLPYNMAGALLWVGVWTTIAYFGGGHIQTFLRYELYFTIASIVGFILYILYKHYHKTQLNPDNT